MLNNKSALVTLWAAFGFKSYTIDKNMILKTLLIVLCCLWIFDAQPTCAVVAQQYQEQDGLVVIEAENTRSPLGQWTKSKSLRGYTGDSYLEFNGNQPQPGPANSPLAYRFKINKPGLYYLHLLCAGENQKIDGQPLTDVANGCDVRVAGEFSPGPKAGNKHGNDAPLVTLKKDTPFFGGGDRAFTWASGNRLDSGGDRNKRVAVYKFAAGQTYSLVISGRSQAFKLDRIVFRHRKIHPNSAENRGALETLAEPPKKQGSDRIKPPQGRVAIVADGNSPDPDDIGATAVMLGLLQANQLNERLVHLSHSCDLKPSKRISTEDEKRRQQKLQQICDEGIARFGPFKNLAAHFNCRTQRQAAIDDLGDAIDQSTASDPLWILAAGEPDIIGFALKIADPQKTKWVHVISHHPANDNSGDFFKWQQILDFGVQEHQIGDQNIGLQSKISAWNWAKTHADPNMQWIWQQLSYAEQDGVVKFQTNKFDCSDAGLLYWWITGANQNGNRNATPTDIKKRLTTTPKTEPRTGDANEPTPAATTADDQAQNQPIGQPLGQALGQSPATKTNVLIFHMDDLRPELGCYDADYIKSPNIDALAAQGVLFQRAYCQQALCAPSRISMMSGMYPDTTGIYDLWTPITKVMPKAVTMPRYFKKRGYQTLSFGKVYHHTRDDKDSWTVLQPKHPVIYANPKTIDAIAQRRQAGQAKGVGVSELRTLSKGPAFEILDAPDNAYPDGKTAQQAIDALIKSDGKPFFMCVGFTKPHLPFAAPKRYWDQYQRDEFDVPERKLADGTPTLAITKWGELRNYRGIPDQGPLSDDLTRQLKHGYAASVSFADAQVGKVLAELDRQNLRKNTIIVLWGDHGYKLGDYGLWCKHTNLELDARVPLIVSAPGFKSNVRTQSLVEMVDLFPTLAKLSGGDIPATCDGKSLEPLLKNPEQPFRDYTVSQYPRGTKMGYSLRDSRWRYTEWIHTQTKEIALRELYDHQSTQRPNQNLAKQPEHEKVVARLSKLLNARQRLEKLDNKNRSTNSSRSQK